MYIDELDQLEGEKSTTCHNEEASPSSSATTLADKLATAKHKEILRLFGKNSGVCDAEAFNSSATTLVAAKKSKGKKAVVSKGIKNTQKTTCYRFEE